VENQEPPEWLVELSLALLADHRHVTVLDNAKIPRETSLTIASLSSDLAVVVSHSKNQQARQMLVDLLNTGGIDLPTLMALAKMGDKRAVPFLIEALAAAKTLPPDREQRLAPEYASAVSALARLKARDAVPVLLRHVEYLEIIDCLGTIGDPRALPVLHKVVASKGTVLRDGRRINSELEGERLFAARMAMARIDDADEIPQLVQMLTEPSLTRSHRYDIVTRLADRPESQAIPQLLKVIRTDADYYIIDLAIQGLAQRKDKAAVVGLIDCLDAPFKEFVRTKENRATSATYHNLIACALHRITGQKFGADKVRWQKWWQETGRNSTALK
jgi:HEAT repeat protein